MPRTGENVARDHGIIRADEDAFALRSQQRAAAALGFHAEEIVPVTVPGRKRGETTQIRQDEHPCADTTIETLSGLKPLFGPDGAVTVGPDLRVPTVFPCRTGFTMSLPKS